MNYQEVAKSCFAVAGAGGIFGLLAAMAGLLINQPSLFEASLPFLAAGLLAALLGLAVRRLQQH